ncbi:MAG: AraC family transcriptional regulator [Acutalibacteraceae bacterium]
MLGFESVYYFSRVFKKITGMSPSLWHEKQYLMLF